MEALRQLRTRNSSPDMWAARSRHSAAGDERVRTANVGAPPPPPRSGAHGTPGVLGIGPSIRASSCAEPMSVRSRHTCG